MSLLLSLFFFFSFRFVLFIFLFLFCFCFLFLLRDSEALVHHAIFHHPLTLFRHEQKGRTTIVLGRSQMHAGQDPYSYESGTEDVIV